MKKIKILYLFVFIATVFFMFSLTSCSSSNSSKAHCYVQGKVTLKWNALSDYYYLQADICNDGGATAEDVFVTYYYLNQNDLIKYESVDYVGDIEPNSSETFVSSPIRNAPLGVVNYGISKVEWD